MTIHSFVLISQLYLQKIVFGRFITSVNESSTCIYGIHMGIQNPCRIVPTATKEECVDPPGVLALE